VQDVDYANGVLRGLAVNGAAAAEPENVGPTLFDFVKADAGQIQASHDEPFYAIITVADPCAPAPGGGVSCQRTPLDGVSSPVKRTV